MFDPFGVCCFGLRAKEMARNKIRFVSDYLSRNHCDGR